MCKMQTEKENLSMLRPQHNAQVFVNFASCDLDWLSYTQK